eukprot:1196708-Rhodomonas_salina.3
MKAEDDREDYLLFGVSVSRLVSKPVNGVSSYTASGLEVAELVRSFAVSWQASDGVCHRNRVGEYLAVTCDM